MCAKSVAIKNAERRIGNGGIILLGFSQTVRMNKIKVFQGDGKSRDEKEACFPSMKGKDGKGGQV